MINRNSYNVHNGNLRGQGGTGPWIADINNEIYQNLDNLDSEIGSEKKRVDLIIQTELPSKQNILDDHDRRIVNSQNQINQILNSDLIQKQNTLNDHENRLQSHQSNINNFSNDLSQKQNQLNQVISDNSNQDLKLDEHKVLLSRYGSKIEEFDQLISKIDRESLEYLGQFYEEVAKGGKSEEGLISDRNSWLKITYGSFIALLAFNLLAIYVVFDNLNLTKQDLLYLIPIDFLFFTFIYFVISQYTYYKKLYMEYINRSVVAKTYLSILKGVDAPEERNVITKIVADTLFSRNASDQGNDLPLKDALRFGEKVLDYKKV